MKLRKFLLRYYPPGIILEYEQARAVWERGEEAGRPGGGKGGKEIGRASCRERVYVLV